VPLYCFLKNSQSQRVNAISLDSTRQIIQQPKLQPYPLPVIAMPMHNAFLPREGFKADAVLKIIRNTALNPKLLLPLLLLVKYTKKGQDWAVLHPKAYSRLKKLLVFSLIRCINRYFSRGVLNNWVDDKYDWSKEIVVITGGAGGIGGQVVQLLAERGIKVVVLDIQPLTYPAGIKWRTTREIQHISFLATDKMF